MEHLETATFAAGCFWGVEEDFGMIKGVVKTRVGYTGGPTQNPTYKEVCGGGTGHAEAVEIVFDTRRTTYQDLLRLFFSIHSASSVAMQGANQSGQYRSAIFYHGEAQKSAAEAFIKELETNRKRGTPVYTQVAPAGFFWEAETYHQKYNQKNGSHC